MSDTPATVHSRRATYEKGFEKDAEALSLLKKLKLAPEPPPLGTKVGRDYFLELIRHFYTHYRELTRQDAVGCAIAYLSMYYIPREAPLDKDRAITYQVVGEFLRIVPDLMQEAGFIPTLAYPAPLAAEIPLQLFRVWAAVLDQKCKPKDRREEVLKILWCVEIVPHTITLEQELKALEKAARFAHLSVDAEELRGELWGAALPPKALYRREDGNYQWDPLTLKEVFRRPENHDRLAPISVTVKVKARDSEGRVIEKRKRVRARSLDAPAPSGDVTLADTVPAPEPGSPSEKSLSERGAFEAAVQVEEDREALEKILEWKARQTECSLEEVAGTPEMAKRARHCMERLARRARRLAQ